MMPPGLRRPPLVPPIACNQCGRRAGICTPVMVVPIKDFPVPVYVQYKGRLCQQCANAFSPKTFTGWDARWYDRVCDHLRSLKKPAVNPYPHDANFKWESFILTPDWEPAPREQCIIQFWKTETLAAKGMHAPMATFAGKKRG